MYTIRTDFEGANCRVLSLCRDTAHVEVDLRDTQGDWFYWCFRVEGAEGQTITFRFDSPIRVGYFGAAVSHDFRTWHWQYPDTGHQGDCFTYTFSENESSVWFAHDMLYRPAQFEAFCKERSLVTSPLCHTEKGRAVPHLVVGRGEETILLTARHHACESTGSYVLEGVLEALLPYQDEFRIVVVPFVDYDGVVDGDQGKNRAPHDHNRDYETEKASLYATTAAIRQLGERYPIRFAFDFHSPWHLGDGNDTVMIPQKVLGNSQVFSALLERENGSEGLPHYERDDVLPDTQWNASDAPTFAVYWLKHGAEVALTLETPYFVASGVPFTMRRAKETGRAFARALLAYRNQSPKA